ncbi:hypothetical protein, partial [Hymenobacter frigidus]
TTTTWRTCSPELLNVFSLTADGPFVDDWFIVFMTSEKVWNQISEYTPGMPAVLQELGTYLDAK